MQLSEILSSHFTDGGVFAKRFKAPERVMSAGLVAALHVVLVFAFLNAIGVVRVDPGPPRIDLAHFKPDPKPKAADPPPRTLTFEPVDTNITEPMVIIQNAEPGNGAITGTAAPVPDTRPLGIAPTHTIPDYPILSRRLSEEGVVLLAITIGADGRVSATELTRSSGFSRLDDAALSWVKDHWRYRPALKDGQPIESKAQAAVRFELH